MSFAFDTQMWVWDRHIEPLIEDKELAMYFRELMDEMHSANKGDGINKDLRVTAAARQLDGYFLMKDLEEGKL